MAAFAFNVEAASRSTGKGATWTRPGRQGACGTIQAGKMPAPQQAGRGARAYVGKSKGSMGSMGILNCKANPAIGRIVRVMEMATGREELSPRIIAGTPHPRDARLTFLQPLTGGRQAATLKS